MNKIREGGFLISKIKQISERIFDKKLKNIGINDLNNAQGRIIFSLWQTDNITITELARRTALGKTTLTSMLDRLEQVGYIISNADKTDKRTQCISLTNKSKSLENLYSQVSKDMTLLFYRGLSEKQIDEFEEALKKILANLVEYERQSKYSL
jgi:MarR family transcriptional regulator, organic hydroperoxide resistance regulator